MNRGRETPWTDKLFDLDGAYGHLVDLIYYVPATALTIGYGIVFLLVILAIPVGILIEQNPAYELLLDSVADYILYKIFIEGMGYVMYAVGGYIVYALSIFFLPTIFFYIERAIRAALSLFRRADPR